MQQQIAFVEQRDGCAAALQYAQTALKLYRQAAKNQKHYAHSTTMVSAYAQGIREIRAYLRGSK